ncbi:MAG: methylated-DNA--[protein]-cysteine S-methyltransferase [Pseudomonadota bacterium]
MTEQHRVLLPPVEDMYAAIERRDPVYDGLFFYGVITTGVYCLPSCGARLPRRENVRFFDSTSAAERAGLRPCKRCRPAQTLAERAALIELAHYLEKHATEKLSNDDLVAQSGIPTPRLTRQFKGLFGVTPKAFQEEIRRRGLKAALKRGTGVAEAIFEAGYGSTSRIYGESLRNLGMTPSSYRAGGAGELIYHAACETALGWLMLAATERGVCFAQFGASAADLLRQLATEFPAAELKPSEAVGHPELDRWLAAIEAHLGADGPRPDLPLDLRGTAFQIKVWRYLLGTREGEVLSYGELASAIDAPKAVRAAASACGANRVAVLVPCHRVLRGNGDLGGYRWEEARKRTLLDHERRRAKRQP